MKGPVTGSPLWRCNVAALVMDPSQPGKVLGCQRGDHPHWQTVQGGVEALDPSLEGAILREMEEELGVARDQVHITYRSPYWRRYTFPPHLMAKEKKGLNRPHLGQDQLWFVVHLRKGATIHLPRGGEFVGTAFMDPAALVEEYVWWKKQPFVDFCHECGLLT